MENFGEVYKDSEGGNRIRKDRDVMQRGPKKKKKK